MIKKISEKIVNWLDEDGRHFSFLLNDPLEKEEIDSLTSNLPIKLPEELKQFYQWHNGTVNEKGYTYNMISFFPGFFFISLNEAIGYYNTFIRDDRWAESWFPVFGNGGGDFFVIKCSKNVELKQAEILGFMLDFDETEVEYLTLTKMLETIYFCYLEGAYYLDENDNLKTNLKKEATIANRMNPNLDRWKNEI